MFATVNYQLGLIPHLLGEDEYQMLDEELAVADSENSADPSACYARKFYHSFVAR